MVCLNAAEVQAQAVPDGDGADDEADGDETPTAAVIMGMVSNGPAGGDQADAGDDRRSRVLLSRLAKLVAGLPTQSTRRDGVEHDGRGGCQADRASA